MKEVSLNELDCWRVEKRIYQLIDVRDRQEHLEFNIGGVLVPLPELRQHIVHFEASLPVVVYCKRGIRSQIAIQRLQHWGIKGDFYNLKGGILPLLKT